MHTDQVFDSDESASLVVQLHRVSKLASVTVVAIGVVVIVGWLLDLPLLKSVIPDAPAMKVNTAVCLILAGSALWLWHQKQTPGQKSHQPRIRGIVQGCACLITLIAGLTLAQYNLGIDLGIDQLLMAQPEPIKQVAFPGRMPANTALAFLLIGGALVAVTLPRPLYIVIQASAIVVSVIALLGVLEYGYANAISNPTDFYSGIALHTAVALLLLSLSILFVYPNRGLIAVITRMDAGGLMARRLLPVAIVFPLLICWLIILGYQLRLYHAKLSINFLSVAVVLVFAGWVWRNAFLLSQLDRRRHLAELALRQINEALEEQVEARTTELRQAKAALERRVQERTAELKQANDRLQQELFERERIERALRDSEERFRSAFDYAAIGMALLSPTGNWLKVNQFACEIIGYSEAELLTSNFQAITHPDDLELDLRHLDQMMAGEIPAYQMEKRYFHKQGHLIWIHFCTSLVKDEIGHPLYLITQIQDITARKQAEASLRQSEATNRAILRAMPDLLVQMKRDGTYLGLFKGENFKLFNPQIARTGINIYDALPYSIAQRRMDYVQQVLATGNPYVYEHEIDIDGEHRYEETRIVKSGDDEVLIVVRDITDRKQAEIALRQSQERYCAVVEDQTELILRFLPDTTVLFANGAFCRYFGLQREEVIGKSYEIVVFQDDCDYVAQQVGTMSRENPVVMIENRVVVAGEVRWTQWINRMIFDQQGNFVEYQSVGRDINEHKTLERELAEKQQLLNGFINSAPVGMTVLDRELRYSLINEALADINGIAAADHIGKTPWEIVPDLASKQEKMFQHVLTTGEPILSVEITGETLKHPGSTRTWLVSYFPIQSEGGQPIGIGTVVAEITDRKRAEEKLKRSEAALAQAQRIAHIGSWELDVATQKITWSDEFKRILGFDSTQPDPSFTRHFQRIYPDDRALLQHHIEQTIVQGTAYELDLRVLRKNGTLGYIEARGEAIFDEDDRIIRLVGTALDITDRRRAEAELRESDRRWRSLLDHVQLVVIGLDRAGNVEYANPFFLELTGYTHAEVIGKHWFNNFVPPDQQTSVQAALGNVAEQKVSPYYQNPILTKAGEERIIAWNNTLLQDLQGNSIGTLSIGEDITEQSRLDRMKSEFISVVSHELRTPLTSMQGALSLLEGGLVDPGSTRGQRIIQIATEGVDRLVRLVNDILDLERLGSGKIHLEKTMCNVADLMNNASEQMQVMANRANITLAVSPQPFQLYADPDRVLQVLTNLLSNAIKFSESGSTVWLTVSQPEAENTEPLPAQSSNDYSAAGELLFMVRDRGRGIPSDKLDSIFERFKQIDASDSRQKGGTGLGLAICRSIVQQHGGRIWVESQLGEGSCFYFTLPQRKNG